MFERLTDKNAQPSGTVANWASRKRGCKLKGDHPKTSDKSRVWIEAKKKYHLTDAQIQMARELGLNPKKFGGLANNRQEPWKKPLSEFIEELYFKRLGKTQPDTIKKLD